MISTVLTAQRGNKDSNRIGIGAGLTQLNIYTDNFTVNPESGWIGGFSVRGNYYNNWQMSFGMFFTDSNFSIPTLKGLQQTQTNFKMSAVQIYIVPSYVAIEDHLNLEFGPVLQVNGKLGVNKNDENNLLLDQPGLIAKDILDVSKFNAMLFIMIFIVWLGNSFFNPYLFSSPGGIAFSMILMLINSDLFKVHYEKN